MAEARSTNEKGGDGEIAREMRGGGGDHSTPTFIFQGRNRFFGVRSDETFRGRGDRKWRNSDLDFERGYLLTVKNKLGWDLFLLLAILGWKLCVFLILRDKISMMEMFEIFNLRLNM